jgi:hypothetical protein
MPLIGVHRPLAREQVKRSQLEIIERFNRPAITLVLANILLHGMKAQCRSVCELVQAREPF